MLVPGWWAVNGMGDVSTQIFQLELVRLIWCPLIALDRYGKLRVKKCNQGHLDVKEQDLIDTSIYLIPMLAIVVLTPK